MAFLAGLNFIIKTDMTKQFFQLPMLKSSMKYLGTLTPFKGLRVYTRAAMGMPGSTEHLDQLMSRVLGNLMREGIMIKLADDLYTGGNTIPDLLYNWERILQCLEANNLRLSASSDLSGDDINSGMDMVCRQHKCITTQSLPAYGSEKAKYGQRLGLLA